MRKEIIVAGHLSKSNWGGQYQAREQDFVIDENGICMSIPSSYERHPFKVLVYEELQDMAQTTRILRGGILKPLIFPTITTRTGDADIDLIVKIYEQQETYEDDKGGENPQ